MIAATMEATDEQINLDAVQDGYVGLAVADQDGGLDAESAPELTAEELPAEQQAEELGTPEELLSKLETERDEARKERDDAVKQRDESNQKLDKLNLRDAKIRDAESHVSAQDEVIESIKDELKHAKEEREKRFGYLQGLIRQRETGQKEMDFDAPAAEPAAVVEPAAPVDQYLALPIAELGAKAMKANFATEFSAAKDRDEPIGLTPGLLDKLAEKEIGTIGALEAAFQASQDWRGTLGFTEKQADRLLETHRVWRTRHPYPGAASEAAPEPLRTMPEVSELEQAVSDLNQLVKDCDELLQDGPAASIEFAESVRDGAVSMRDEIAEKNRVTESQRGAIANWMEGVAKWNV